MIVMIIIIIVIIIIVIIIIVIIRAFNLIVIDNYHVKVWKIIFPIH